MAELPAITFGKLVKRKIEARVSFGGKETLRDVVEERAVEVAKKAVAFAEHAGRKTVKAEDIELALKA